ncbi:hypothetical protein PoMZ_08056, partial [Pyricularia oryzae]
NLDFAYPARQEFVTWSRYHFRAQGSITGRPEHAYATKHPNFHDRKRFPELNDIILHRD